VTLKKNKQLSKKEKQLRNKKNRLKARDKKKKERLILLRSKQLKGQKSQLRRPLIKVKIHSKHYSSLLDSGSNICLIGSKLFDRLRDKNVKTWYVNKRIQMVSGITDVKGGVTIKIHTPMGNFVQNFFAVEDGTEQVILGQDFLDKAKIGLTAHGWFLIKEKDKVYPFATLPKISDIEKTEQAKVAVLHEKDEIRKLVLPMIENDENNVMHDVIDNHINEGTFSFKPGLAKGVEQVIRISEGPSYQAALRPMNAKMRKILEIKVQELLDEGIIEPSDSDFLCAPVLVRKGKNKSSDSMAGKIFHEQQNENVSPEQLAIQEAKYWRLCLDLRPVNARLISVEPYKLPPIDYILSQLANADYYTIIDLKSGFNQLQVEKESRRLQAFRTHKGCFQYVRATFGLAKTPFEFQRHIDRILEEDYWECAAAYLDDIIIWSKGTLQQHSEKVDKVLNKLKAAGLTVNPEKVKFACKEIKLLGFIVSGNELRQDPEKVAAIKNFPTPTNKKQLQQYLGMANFLRHFLPQLSMAAKPLNRLTGDVDWCWGEAEQKAFDTIKNDICSEKCTLALPDLNRPFTIITDASAIGVGGALMQKDRQGVLKPVSYTSRTCTKLESSLCSTELELLAVIHCCQVFEPYIQYSEEIIVETDHSALKQIFYMNNLSGKIRRWLMKLMHLKLIITYRKGRLNQLADALSRNPDPEGKQTNDWREKLLPTHELTESLIKFDPENLTTPAHKCHKCCDKLYIVHKEDKRDEKMVKQAERLVQKTHTVARSRKAGRKIKEPQDPMCPILDLPPFRESIFDSPTAKLKKVKTEIRKSIPQKVKAPKVRVTKRKKRKPQWPKIKFLTGSVYPNLQERRAKEAFYSYASQLIALKNLPASETDWAIEQDKDNHLLALKQLIKIGKTTKFHINNNNLLLTELDQIVVPDHLRKLALEICHDSLMGGHYGTKKTGQKLAENFNWKGMKKDAAVWVRSCEICQRIKSTNKKKVGFFASKPETAVGKEVSIDIFGPLPRSSKGNKYALIIVDNYSKWVEVFPLRTITSPVLLERVINYLFRNGWCDTLKSDNAVMFHSKLWKQVLGYMGVQQKFLVPYRPQSNISERMIKECKMRIKAYAAEHKSWDKHLDAFAFCLRSTVNKSTGFTPNALHLGRELKNPLIARDSKPPTAETPVQHAVQTIKFMTQAYQMADTNIAKSKLEMELQYNRKRRAHNFQIGQLVLLEVHKLSDAGKKFTAGLAPKRSEEIYQIIDQIAANTFKICQLGTTKEKVANADQLSLYLARPTYLQ
jgi:RNase H-like domain found in reverse transcriptase/Reverse transcriptase (RNA-dependent DNA polymerase)/Integrase zinc binding domain/Retroviral aspartyl protease